jgi:hypothetical protein
MANIIIDESNFFEMCKRHPLDSVSLTGSMVEVMYQSFKDRMKQEDQADLINENCKSGNSIVSQGNKPVYSASSDPRLMQPMSKSDLDKCN